MKTLICKFNTNMVKAAVSVRVILANKSGEGMIDMSIQILISVILGALVLGGLYLLFNSTVLPEVANKISDMFNYAG